ncbi:PcfJ domain-containing protein [Bradyrhizobium sp. USDA 4341]
MTEAIAELTGGPEPGGHIPLRDACHRIAAAYDCPAGPVLLEAIRQRHRIVAHRICDRESAIRIAHGVAARRTMAGLVRKGLGKAAKRAGLRDARPRPWHRDPAIAAKLEALVDRFFDTFRPFVVDSENDVIWRYALVIPHPPNMFEGSYGADVLAVSGADTPVLDCVHIDRDCRPFDLDEGRIARIRTAITQAIAGPQRLKPEQIWRAADGHGSLSAVKEIAPLQSWPRSAEYGFWRRIQYCWDRTQANGLAHFRRRLPQEIQDHAAMAGRKFADPQTTAEFFAGRPGWSLEDYKRANQALRAVPILRAAILEPEVSQIILTGQPIERAIRAIVNAERPADEMRTPLHAKTVQSLSKSYRLTVVGAPALASNFGDVVPVVDAIFKANPHHVVLDGTELSEIRALVKFDRSSIDLRMRVALAHRNAKGRIRDCPNLLDTYSWIYQRAALVITGTDSPSGDQHGRIVRAAYDILFPEGRTLAGLTALNRTWHEEQRHLDETFQRLKLSLLTSRIEILKQSSGLYPHFMTSETEIAGVKMRPLVDESDIIQEGKDLEHCVGRYTGFAAAGRSMLVSQISKEGRSTVEVYLESENVNGIMRRKLSVSQNQARNNTEPPPTHHSAMAKLLKSFTREFLLELDQRIQAASLVADRHRGDVYNALPKEDIELLQDHAFADIKRYLPNRTKRLSRQAWQALYPFQASDRCEPEELPVPF